MKDPTLITVDLNHLEAMGIGMALWAEKERDGLSEPQVDALDKIQACIGEHMKRLGIGC